MDWKEFFKPNKQKMIIIVILAALALISVAGKMIVIFCIIAPCTQPWPYGDPLFVGTNNLLALPYNLVMSNIPFTHSDVYGNWNIWGYDIGKWENWMTTYNRTITKVFPLIGVALTLAYLYLISCAISFSVKKIKNKLN